MNTCGIQSRDRMRFQTKRTVLQPHPRRLRSPLWASLATYRQARWLSANYLRGVVCPSEGTPNGFKSE